MFRIRGSYMHLFRDVLVHPGDFKMNITGEALA